MIITGLNRGITMTRQSEDKLIYDNYEYSIRNELYLENYIHTHVSIPPMKLYSTACHRMYHAVFIFKNNRLYLQAINNEKVDMPIDYTGVLNLYDGYTLVETENDGVPCLAFDDKLVIKLWLKAGRIIKEEKYNQK